MQTLQRQHSARFKRWTLCLLAAGMGIGLLVFSAQDRLRLLERAIPITKVHGWGLDRPDLNVPLRFYDMMSGGANYQWLEDHQILFFQDLKPIQVVETRTNTGNHLGLSWPASVGTPTVYDVAAHQEHSLPTLTRLFQREAGKAANTAVSPDGTRLLWKDAGDTLHIARLDASRQATIPNVYDVATRWLPSGQQFYGYGWGESEQHKNVFTVHTWEASTGKLTAEKQFPQPKGYDLMGECALTPEGEMAANTLHLLRPKLTLYLLSAFPMSAVRAFPITLPPNTTVDALEYSPQGDHLAWVMTRTSLPPLLQSVSHWLPFYKPRPQRVTSLWVSSAKGTSLHEIGHIPAGEPGRQFYLIDYVRWLPDGKRLSFISKDVLYTVAAD